MKKMLAVSTILLLLIGITAAVSWASEIYTEIDAYRACAFSETLTTQFAEFNQFAEVTGPSSYLYVDQSLYTDGWGSDMMVEQYVDGAGCSVDYHQDIGLQVEDAFLMTAGLDISGQDGYLELDGEEGGYSTIVAGYDDDNEEGLLGMDGGLFAGFIEEGSFTLGHYLQANCCPIELYYMLDDYGSSSVYQGGIVTPGDSYGFSFTIPLPLDEEGGSNLYFYIDDEAWCDWEGGEPLD